MLFASDTFGEANLLAQLIPFGHTHKIAKTAKNLN